METVILLTAYGEYGATGFIINRPTRIGLSTILPEAFKDWNDIIFIGGPVAGHNMSFLIRSAKQPQDSGRVFKDVYVVGIKEALQYMLEEGSSKATVRAYMGYAGWSPAQLEKEVMRGDWLVSDGDAAAIFDKDHEGLWEELYRKWSTQEVAQNS